MITKKLNTKVVVDGLVVTEQNRVRSVSKNQSTIIFFYVCPFQCVAHGDLQVKKDLKIILTGIVFPGAYRCLFCLLSPTAFGIRTSKTSIDPTLLVPFFHFWRTFLYVLVPKRPPIAKRTLILSNKFEFFPSYICMRILPSMPREYPANLYISFLIHF